MFIKVWLKMCVFFLSTFHFVDVNILFDKFCTDNCYGGKVFLKFTYFEGSSSYKKKKTILLEVVLFIYCLFLLDLL